MSEPFLTSRWKFSCLLNFAVPAELLKPHVPPGLEVELYQGEAFVSLEAMDWEETRVLGVQWPGYGRFPAVNLRFYVRCGESRGVVYLGEWVPYHLVAWLGRKIYNEPFRATPMVSKVEKIPPGVVVEHCLHLGGRTHRLRVMGRDPPLMAPPGSMEHHFKEQQWGFGVDKAGTPRYVEVQHPPWFCYPVEDCQMDWAWGDVFGEKWSILDGRIPDTAVLSVGGEVQLFPLEVLE